jgi:hypothetical protein
MPKHALISLHDSEAKAQRATIETVARIFRR